MPIDREQQRAGTSGGQILDPYADDAREPANPELARRQQAVKRADRWNKGDGALWVMEFLRLTGDACADGRGGVSVMLVRRWQHAHGVHADGMVGPETVTAADAARGGAAASASAAASTATATASSSEAASASASSSSSSSSASLPAHKAHAAVQKPAVDELAHEAPPSQEHAAAEPHKKAHQAHHDKPHQKPLRADWLEEVVDNKARLHRIGEVICIMYRSNEVDYWTAVHWYEKLASASKLGDEVTQPMCEKLTDDLKVIALQIHDASYEFVPGLR
jgi:hypothetical protein